MGPPEVAILGSGGAEGWHGARLRAALEGLGILVHRIPFESCRFALDDHGPGIRLGDLQHLPDGVVVRSIPAGTFEQVTLRLGILHALEASGVPVSNGARPIERCVDKAAASFLLARAGLPSPATWVVDGFDEAAAVVREAQSHGCALVLKPLFGNQGKGLRLVRGPDDLPPPEAVAGVYYLQRFVGRPDGAGLDFRVFVVGGEAVAAMARHAPGWVTNIGRGGVPRPVRAVGVLAELAVAAAAALGTDHAGVDLIEDGAGRLQVLEVNSMPAWQGLQSVATTDIAARLAADLSRRVIRGPR